MKPPTSKFLSPGIVFVSKTSNPKTTFPSLSPRQRTHSEVSGPFLPPLWRFLPGRILTAEITAFFGRKTCTILTHLMDENVYIYIYICHNLIITVKTRVLSHMMAYISHKISGHCILGQKTLVHSGKLEASRILATPKLYPSWRIGHIDCIIDLPHTSRHGQGCAWFCFAQTNLRGQKIYIYIYIWSSPPWFPPTPPPKGGIRHTYAAMYRYNYMFVLIYVCMPACLTVCLLVCKYVRVPARSTCHCFCVCTQRYYMYT